MKEFDDEHKYGVYDNEELLQRFGVRDEAETYLFDLLNKMPFVENRLISDDEEFIEGQLSKTMFLDKMESNIKDELRVAFEGTKFSEVSCPWLENLFRHYRRRDANYLESSLHKYLPINDGIIKAEDYIPLVSEKVKRAVDTWLSTGEITEVPDEVPKHFMQTAEQYAANLRAKMGEGKPLDGKTKNKMEGAFGSNLGEVNIHTDQQADKIAQEADAVALTIGSDIAFAANKYKPGTPEGDGLLAHELAHALQQKNATEPGKGDNYSSMEKDAEASTEGVLSRLLGNAKSGISDWSKQIMPRMKSGLQLQRCKSDDYEITYDSLMAEAKESYKQGNYDESIEFFVQAIDLTDSTEEKNRARKGIRDVLSAQNDREYVAPTSIDQNWSYDADMVESLMDYIKNLQSTGQPMRASDSKPKAREVIRAWIRGDVFAVITDQIKTALILELNEGELLDSDRELIDKMNDLYSTNLIDNNVIFSDEKIWKIIDMVYRNARPDAESHLDCITTVRNIVLDTLFSNKSEDEKQRILDNINEYANVIVPGSNPPKPYNRMQDSMHGLVDSGYAYELLDQYDNYISFAKKNNRKVQNHPTASERIIEDISSKGRLTGKYVYGLSVVDGHHSMIVIVDYRSAGNYHIYLLDQLNYTGRDEAHYNLKGSIPGARVFNTAESFDSYIDYATTSWGMDETKTKDICRIWSINPNKE